MVKLFNFRKKKNEFEEVTKIHIIESKTEQGIVYQLLNQKTNDSLSFPLQLSISELKLQDQLDTLEALEQLWYEEALIDNEGKYLLQAEFIFQLDEEYLKQLKIPSPTSFQLKLGHEGIIGTSKFKFILEKHLNNWNHIERTGKQIGPWVKLADGTEYLMSSEQFEFQKDLKTIPGMENKEDILGYVASIRSKAKQLNIPMDEYLEKQQYLFIDQLELDLNYDGKEIALLPKFKSNDNISQNILDIMSDKKARYLSQDGSKIFVNKETSKQADILRESPTIKGQAIPSFVESPEAFIPEFAGIDLSQFSDRVKNLGIKVYKAQPFVFATEKERGWFGLTTGFSAVDELGEKQDFANEEIEILISEAKNKGQNYIEWNGHWLKIPENASEFIEGTKKISEEIVNDNGIQLHKLPYILEIFENIDHLEFNQPLLDLQTVFKDSGIFEKITPKSFNATLKPFQVDGYIWMKYLHYRRIGGLLADDMGLGKTVQVISFLTYLYEKNGLQPTLIVAPKTLIENWKNEIGKFAPQLLNKLYTHQGTSRYKYPESLNQCNIILTTYQTLVNDQLLFGQVNWSAVICDEAQPMKNPSTSASHVIKALKARMRLALTGTPVENSLIDLWSIVDYVQPGLLGSLSTFKKEFVTPLKSGDNANRIEKELISRISSVYKRRTKSEELSGQLPEKKIISNPVPIGEIQLKLYSEVIALVKNGMMKGLEAVQHLKKLSSHPALLSESYENVSFKEIPKLKETIDIIHSVRQKGEKVLIFTEYIKMQSILRKCIRDEFNVKPMIINGQTDKRMDIVELFNQKDGFDVMILSPKAAGTGLTITSANHVIHYTRWWNPAVENQATDRVYRIGQEKDVYVYHPIVTDTNGFTQNGTVEEIVHRILEEKQHLASNIVTTTKSVNFEDEVLGVLLG
ncbi:DEAD/DEAH box helicase [Bacillus sp. UNCCL81]|uniref:DEAD/DEAH box helicase n=1 Tax=Bacillus sp. UNCCL81 TaxID=1502755 RepID=UPI0008E8809E|nr:DEAD/DEAH box helicase [Bacillus sp. UNCCL81]SFC95236.1 Helicase conserved C-terminal domain-containing protein [Bacillus sp. UNCCL81]